MIKSIKKILIGILISISIFNASAFAYEDVLNGSPYFNQVEYLRRNHVVPDSRLFNPDVIISKAQFIKYLVLLNSPKTRFKNIEINLPYEDTLDSAWYAPYFQEAITLGILSDRETRIDPYRKLTIMEALELLFHSKSIPIPKRYIGIISYQDIQKNKSAQPLVMRAIQLGIVEPERGDYFGLYRRVTKIKAAKMIYEMDMISFEQPGRSQGMQNLDPSLQKIVNVWELINSDFVDSDKINTKDLSDSAIRALVETLEDPYSAFMDAEENQAFSDEFDGEIEGIGAFVAIDENGEITIVAPISDSPAFHAGVKAGDIIRKVDDFSTEGENLYDVVNRIKGPKGTKVKLTLERNGRNVIIEVVRDVINIYSLEYEVIGNGKIMHIKLLNFNQNAVKDFREVVEIITQNPNIKGVVLDLRNNPGGLLDVSIGILNFLLPHNSIAVHIKYSYFNFTQYTSGQGELQDYPMVVLVNKGSASASEILAGALQDYDIAKIIGETTFGKGTVQEINYFGDSSSLKLTVAEWLTSNLNSIQGNGIEPDIEVLAGQSGTDNQLSRAIQELNRMIR